jgi:hypothetical protein
MDTTVPKVHIPRFGLYFVSHAVLKLGEYLFEICNIFIQR